MRISDWSSDVCSSDLRRGERDAAILVGSGVALWLGWVSGSVTGHLAGAALGDPRLYGADVVVPAFFAIMLAPLWPGWAGAWPWAIAAGVAVAAPMVLPGYWHVIAGGLAASLARSEERRVGHEWGETCRTQGWPRP